MRVLLTGDLHLGRSSSGVVASSASLRAADAWERIVDLAVERDVAAVIVSGDIVDHSNRFFEATGPLSRGLRRLATAGIVTIAVAGNHDHGVLVALAQQYAGPEFGFTVLGRGGTWEKTVIAKHNCPSFRIVGWSFPAESHALDPLGTFPQDLPQDLPVLGLVHGDLDVRESRYAPLNGATLKAKPVAGWLLGHIHAPRLREDTGCPWILYPGSPQALDPGEQGVHGVWIAEVSQSAVRLPVLIPLASVRYECVTVDVGDVADETALRVRIRDGLRRRADEAREESGEHLATLVADLVVEGTTPVADLVESCLGDLEELHGLDASIAVEVRKSSSRAMRPIDIRALSQGRSLPAILARLVLDLESGVRSPDANDVLARGRSAVAALTLMSRVPEGDHEVPLKFTDDAVRRILSTGARKLLASLTATGSSDPRESRA